MDSSIERLAEILANMDIPVSRLSPDALSEAHNLRWLTRNMFIRNGSHRDFREASALLVAMLKNSYPQERALDR